MRSRSTGVLLAGLVALTLAELPAQATAQPAAGSSFTTLDEPVRVLDTRDGMPISQAGISFDLDEFLPGDVTAVVLNVTAVSPTRATYVTAHEAGTPRPAVSNLNVRAGEVRSNAVTVPITAGGTRVSLYNHAGNVHLVADLSGYYTAGAGSYFTPMPPPGSSTRGLPAHRSTPGAASPSRSTTWCPRKPPPSWST
jgi:hypothetical protein